MTGADGQTEHRKSAHDRFYAEELTTDSCTVSDGGVLDKLFRRGQSNAQPPASLRDQIAEMLPGDRQGVHCRPHLAALLDGVFRAAR
jgi:hypothetical protein